jgi:hypothetical protein
MNRATRFRVFQTSEATITYSFLRSIYRTLLANETNPNADAPMDDPVLKS